MEKKLYNTAVETILEGITNEDDVVDILIDEVMAENDDIEFEDAEGIATEFLNNYIDDIEKEVRCQNESAKEWEMARSEAIMGAY